MKFLFLLACKNLLRHVRRTLITAGVISIGIMFYLFLDSMLKGADIESVRNLKWYETASVKIFSEEYWDNRYQKPLEINIPDPDPFMSLLKENHYTATKRVEFTGDLILYADDFGENGNMSVHVSGIDPDTDYQVFHFGDTLIDGRFLVAGEDAVIMGSWFAEDIGAKVGYRITIVTRGNGGFFEAMDMEIVGIVNCPNPNVNRSLIMMPLDTADEYMYMDDAVTEIDIKLSDSADVEKELKHIRSILNFPEIRIFSWRELAADYLVMMENERAGTAFILALFFIIAAVGISNTMLMSIMERTREMGMMRAMGMPDRSIRITFMFEAAGIGALGSFLGIILGIVANSYLIYVGLDYGFFMRDMDAGYRIQSIFRGAWNPESMVLIFFLATFFSMLVAYIPTRRSLRMDIPSSLRHQ
jgi:ABC-type lipoprotein release transport system permease subunit